MRGMTEPTPDFEALRERAFNLRWATVAADVIPLTAADPDLPVAQEVTDAVSRYLARPHLCYGPPRGLPEFRTAVAAHFAREKSAAVDAARVVAANAAASAITLVARHLIRPGDEVVVQDPVDFLVTESARRAGAAVVRWRPVDGRFTIEGLARTVTERTRVISVCHPHNPLGRLWSPAEVRDIGAFAQARGITVLSDEVWSDVCLDGRPFESFAATPGSWVVYGLSKGYALAGLRIGAVIAPDAAGAERFAADEGFEHTIEGASTVSQVAGAAALEQAGAWRAAFLRHCAAQRDRAIARLRRLEGVRIASAPEATFVLFVDIRSTERTAEAVAERLESIARVRVVPGSPRWFGDGAEGHIRLSLATTESVLDEALGRIERAWREVVA